MPTYKERLEFLESLRKTPVDLTCIVKSMDYVRDASLGKCVFSSLLKELTNLDVHISVMYNMLTQEEWSKAVANYSTLTEVFRSELETQIRAFIYAYRHMDKVINELEVENILDVFENSLLLRTRNVQFLFFKLCYLHPHIVFKFLLKLLHTNPAVFLPCFASLIVRCDVKKEIKNEYIKIYVDHVRSLCEGYDLKHIVACQSLLYILCFEREMIADACDIVDRMFYSGLVKYMNRRVVDMFCKLFGYECRVFLCCEADCLYRFPFDPPIFDEVFDLISNLYVHFNH